MPFVDLQDLRVHYEEAGSGRNVLVLVHGNFASSRWWQRVFDRLPRGFRAYAMDLRGCGQTESRSGGYSIPRLSSDVGAFVDALDLPAFHLVGHSLGGAVALDFALRCPERVRSLALVAPAPAGGLAAMRNGTSHSARMLRSVSGGALSMFAMREAYRMHGAFGTKRLMLRDALAKMMPGATLDAGVFEALLDDAARLRPEAVVGFFQALDEWNVEEQLPGFEVPTLIVGGGKDVLVPMAELEKMAHLMRHGELRAWPEVGHSPQIERPDEFVDLLIAWTARARKGAWKRALLRFLERMRGFFRSGSRPRSLPAAL
ncbi:MAG: alpha/beta fold hydrolase [Myxococcales bacterium]